MTCSSTVAVALAASGNSSHPDPFSATSAEMSSVRPEMPSSVAQLPYAYEMSG